MPSLFRRCSRHYKQRTSLQYSTERIELHGQSCRNLPGRKWVIDSPPDIEAAKHLNQGAADATKTYHPHLTALQRFRSSSAEVYLLIHAVRFLTQCSAVVVNIPRRVEKKSSPQLRCWLRHWPW